MLFPFFWRKPAKRSIPMEYRVVAVRNDDPSSRFCEVLVERWYDGRFIHGRWQKESEILRYYQDGNLVYTDEARSKLKAHMMAHIAFRDDGRTTRTPYAG
jgi:hypothetical protein